MNLIINPLPVVVVVVSLSSLFLSSQFGEFQELVHRANRAAGSSTRGQLTTKQFRAQLNTPRFRELSPSLDADDLDRVVDKMDVNEDGIVDFSTFIAFLSMEWEALERLAGAVARQLKRNARSQRRFEEKTWEKIRAAQKSAGSLGATQTGWDSDSFGTE